MLDRAFRNGIVKPLSATSICWRCQIQRLPYRSFRSLASSLYPNDTSASPETIANGEDKKEKKSGSTSTSTAAKASRPKSNKFATKSATKPKKLVRKLSSASKKTIKVKRTSLDPKNLQSDRKSEVIASARERQNATRGRLLRHLARNEKEAKAASVDEEEAEPVTFAELSGREADAPISTQAPPELVVKNVEFKGAIYVRSVWACA